MTKRSKSYRAAAEKVHADVLYTPFEAMKLAKETTVTKFDSTVEVVFRLGVDPRQADQMVRGTVSLPHGTGKTARVLVFAVGPRAQEAIDAGADEVGGDELIEKLCERLESGALDHGQPRLVEDVKTRHNNVGAARRIECHVQRSRFAQFHLHTDISIHRWIRTYTYICKEVSTSVRRVHGRNLCDTCLRNLKLILSLVAHMVCRRKKVFPFYESVSRLYAVACSTIENRHVFSL